MPAKNYLEKLPSIYDLNLFRLNALEAPIRVIGFIVIVFVVDTIPHIVSTNLKVNFAVVSMIPASLLDELNFELLYWTS